MMTVDFSLTEITLPNTGKFVIGCDSSKVFGDGTHPTTRTAALLADKYVNVGDEVLDIGTGAGVLSFVADRRGGDVVGIDNHYMILLMAHFNNYINLCDVKFLLQDATRMGIGSFDVILFNLIATLYDCVPQEREIMWRYAIESCKPGGIIITTEMIPSNPNYNIQYPRQFPDSWIADHIDDGDWCGLLLRKPSIVL